MAKKTVQVSSRSAGAARASAGEFFPSNPDSVFRLWMLVPLLLNPILMIHSLDSTGFSGYMVWITLAVIALFFTIRAPWTMIAANPLYITNGVHTVDFYIKSIYIGLVIACAMFFMKSERKSGQPFSINLPELFWLGYLLMGFASLTWSVNPTLGFERLMYILAYGVGAYILGKQTRFWKYSSFWYTYAATALVVGVIEMLMYFLGGEATMEKPLSQLSFRQIIAFDWIMSAGRPSTTLAYRAYAGTYLVTAMPFLLWFMFSKHVKTKAQFFFASAAFIATFVAMFEIRARSAWIGVGASFVVMAALFVLQQRWKTARNLPLALGAFVVAVVLAALPPNTELIEKDRNPQALRGTSKENVGNAITTIGNFARVGQNDRFDFWSMSKRIMFEKSSRDIYEHPFGIPGWVLGVGLNQFPYYVPTYSNILHNLGAEIHNDWVQSFVELGVIGFICWNGFMLALLFYALRDSKTNGLMLAAAGGIVAWVFATQTDFLTPRVYGAVWVAGMAAIIVSEANAAPMITIRKMFWTPWLRRLAGVFFVWHVVSWGITMWCDRQIYIMLTKGEPVDIITERIFNDKNWNAYQHGFGKYLIFSPVSDMSRALGVQIDRYLAEGKTDVARSIQTYQKKVLEQLLVMHPTSYAFLGTMADIHYRQEDYQTAYKYVSRFLTIKPDDWNTWLYCSQIQLALGDSLAAGKSIYRAVQLAPQQGLVQEFWQNRITSTTQEAAIRAMEAEQAGNTAIAPKLNP
jgi:ABC-type multidrug transport system fused ATPase/permease subunit